MKTLVTGEAVLCECNGTLYMSATDVKSLAQWVDTLPDPVLALPYRSYQKLPTGKIPVPEHWSCKKLTSTEGSFSARRKEATANLKKLLQGYPELIYCRMPSYYAYWAFKMAKGGGIPVLTELHGDWSEAFSALPAKNLPVKAMRMAQSVWAKRACTSMGSKSIAVSCIGPKLQERYVSPSVASLVTTNHTVPESLYYSRDSYEHRQTPVLLFVGELERRKGLHILFDSLRMLHEEGGPFQLRLFGLGSAREELTEYAKEHGFSEKVAFCGYAANNNELFDQYRNADVFVLPSIAAEGVPRVIHEAMAMSCPVIATDIGSTAWQLRNNGGVIVPPGDAAGLKQAISKVIASPNLQSDLSESGFETAKCHTYEKQKQQIADFVNKVLDDIKTKHKTS